MKILRDIKGAVLIADNITCICKEWEGDQDEQPFYSVSAYSSRGSCYLYKTLTETQADEKLQEIADYLTSKED